MIERANVLVVDDNLGPRESMRMIPKPLHNVYTAEDGPSALRTIQEKPIDLVTLDLKMPGMDGMSAIADRNVVLVKGKIVFEGSGNELTAQPELMQQYLGI